MSYRNSSGSTPLHLAAATGHTVVVEYLLRQRSVGRVKAALDNDGKSPLAVCLECKMNDWQTTAQLLREAYRVSKHVLIINAVVISSSHSLKMVYLSHQPPSLFRLHLLIIS